MLRITTITLLALVLGLSATAWAQVGRNPISRSGTETEEAEANRAHPVAPAASPATVQAPGEPAGMLPPPIYLNTREIATATAMAAGLKHTASILVSKLSHTLTDHEPTAGDDSEPAPPPPAVEFAFPLSQEDPPAKLPGASPVEPADPPLAEEPSAAPAAISEAPEPIMEPEPEPETPQPVIDVEDDDQTVELVTEEITDEPRLRPERLSVYSPGYVDDAREIAEQLQGNSSEMATPEPEAAVPDPEDVLPVPEVTAPEPAGNDSPSDNPVDFHANWEPRNTNAHRGVGGTHRQLPVTEPAPEEPAPPAPLPVIEPVREVKPQPAPVDSDADVDKLFDDNYPLDQLLAQETADTKNIEPQADVDAPAGLPMVAATSSERDWRWQDNDTPAAAQATGLSASHRFKPLLDTSVNTTRPPVEPRLYFGDPAMPDSDISPGITDISRGNPRLKQVALTFDDGPHPEFTSQLLSVLDFYDVKATFFFVGVQAQKYPHWVKMTHQAGHELACHTYDHFRLPKLPREEKAYQIDEFQRLIENLTGVTPRFLRPPGGRLDAETSSMLTDRGMVLALWDVAINDTHAGKTKDDTLRAALKNIRPGSIVLAHDGIQATIDMLPELIDELREQGYEFVTMSEMASGL